jgi:hypothetical protein
VSPITALWVASLLGASLFFSSGVLSAEVVLRLLGGRLKLAPPFAGGAAGGPARLGRALRAEPRDETRDRPRPDPGELDALRQQLEVERRDGAGLARQLSEVRAHAEEARTRLAEAQDAAALVPALRKRVADMEHAQATRARTTQVLEDKQRALERELARAREDLERLAAQLAARVDTRERAHQQELSELGEQQRERSLRVKLLTERVGQLEAYADENATLRGERDALRREVDRLRRAARESLPPPPAPARDAAPASVTQLTTRLVQSAATRRMPEGEHTLEASLKLHLASLLAREPGLIAVLSDDDGFPVAGVGTDQQQEGVSVLTSLAQELAFRVKEFVDLERIERMELADVAGRALRIRFFDWETHPIALSCLGKRSLATNPEEERVVAAFPKLLRRAGSA